MLHLLGEALQVLRMSAESMHFWKKQTVKFYLQEGDLFGTMCGVVDDALFAKILADSKHVPHRFLPETITHDHNPRKGNHNFKLSYKDDRNFINRQIFRNIYWFESLWYTIIIILYYIALYCMCLYYFLYYNFLVYVFGGLPDNEY